MRRPSPRALRTAAVLIAVAAVGYYLVSRQHHAPAQAVPTTDLSQLITRLETQPASITRVVFEPTDRRVTATLTGGGAVRATYPSDQSALSLQNLLQRQNVEFGAVVPPAAHSSVLMSILISLAPLLLLATFWIFLMRRIAAAGASASS